MRCLERVTSFCSKQLAATIVMGAALTGSVFAQDTLPVSTGDVQWTAYGSDLASSKYVALDQINADNVQQLKILWSWETPDNAVFRADERASAGEYKSTPIMINGVLYVSTSLGMVAAINAVSGEQLWVFDTGSWQRGRHPNFDNNHRGVSWWDDGGDGRILMAANDGQLWSINAKTGLPDTSFGSDGAVDLKLGLGRDTRTGLYGSISPPTVINDVIVVGSSISDGPLFQDQLPPGHVRGYDARTGEQKWIFQTVPQQEQRGAETWENEAWRTAGATNVWTTMSADPETGYVYLPTSTPNNDWYGAHRLGDNLYAESLVCLDAATGEIVWHFQMVHHGLWDYDLPAAPNLLNIEVDGRQIKAVAQTSKQGFVYVFDRLTGEPVWPIEERPVPQSTVPGERSSPTQPFPTKPPPFESQGISDSTLIDFTPELRQQALELIRDIDYGPLYTPPSERGVIVFPGYSGGVTWTGAAVDPETGVMYIPSFSAPRFVRLRKPTEGESDFGYIRDRSFTVSGPQGLPLIKPPYARITAIDLNKGEHLWMVPHGRGIQQRLIQMGIPDPGPVGSFGRHGPLLTKSLLFVAQLDESRPVMRAYDKTNGDVISELDLPLPPMGTPMSYMVNGKQYIVVAAGAGPDTRLLALGLE